MAVDLRAPRSEADWRAARRLVEDYAASIGVDLCFQNLAHELDHLGEEYGLPNGHFLLAWDGPAAIGCVGLRRQADGVGEMKRLYVAPASRGRDVGRRLAEGILAAARRLGYRCVVLDTLPDMKAAQALYATLGFKPTSAYRHNPIAGTVYLELELQ